MPRNTGGIRSRPNFRPGGSNYTNTSYNEDLDCKDLHSFGSIVCNGETRVRGRVISGGLEVGNEDILKVPVIDGGVAGDLPIVAPDKAGLIVVKSVAGASNQNGLFYSRLDKAAADKSEGAQLLKTKAETFLTNNAGANNGAGPSADSLISHLNNYVTNDLNGNVQAGAQEVLTHANTSSPDGGSANNITKPLIDAKSAEIEKDSANTFEWVAAN